MTATLLLAFALPSLDAIGKIVVFLVMLSILVVLHEGGHFLLARLNGVRVNDFAVGFGPTLLKWTSKRSGTNYRLNLLPIGGYCAMQGEDGKSTEAEQQREFRQTVGAAPDAAVAVDDNFQGKSPVGRLSIVVAGPIANFILAFVILFVAAISFGVASDRISQQIGFLVPDSPAVKAGFHMGDAVIAIDGKTFANGQAMIDKIHGSANKRLTITIRRGGVQQDISVTPIAAKNGDKIEGRIGFRPIPTFERVGVLAAIPVAGEEFWNQLTGQISGYADLIAHPIAHYANVSGVIGMERAASVYQDLGWGPYLSLAAAISIALGVLNLLPFPALDGGRAVFILAEMLRGRPVEPEKEALVHVTGFAVLMVLMVFVAYHDIANIVTGKGVF